MKSCAVTITAQFNGCISPSRRSDRPGLYNSSSEPKDKHPAQRTVCYGMLRDVERIWLPNSTLDSMDVQHHGTRACLVGATSAQLSNRTTDILNSLSAVAAISIELSCVKLKHDALSPPVLDAPSQATGRYFMLIAMVYGPRDVADDVGDWLSSMRLYLQTAVSCKQTVPYHNPHKMAETSARMIMTNQLNIRNASSPTALVFDDDVI